MKTKLQTIILSFGILLGGLSAPFLPNIFYEYFNGPPSDRLLNLSIKDISDKLVDASPFIILSLLSLVLLYKPKSASSRLRCLSGVITIFVLIFAGTFDANRSLSYSNYDVGPGLGFIYIFTIPLLYVLGYFLGWVWEMIHGVKDEPAENSADKTNK